VAEVEKGSLAERSGLLKYDVIVRISGQPVEDHGKFREQVITALSGKDFELEVLRAGAHQKMTIHPAHS
jgi:serine protease Do